jgi:hypothetical protein
MYDAEASDTAVSVFPIILYITSCFQNVVDDFKQPDQPEIDMSNTRCLLAQQLLSCWSVTNSSSGFKDAGFILLLCLTFMFEP